MTPAERRFVDYAKRHRWYVLRPSWPDFLVVIDGQIRGVEVKDGRDWASKSQRKTFDLLHAHGFPMYVWYRPLVKNLFPWEEVRQLWCGKRFQVSSFPAYAVPEDQVDGHQD